MPVQPYVFNHSPPQGHDRYLTAQTLADVLDTVDMVYVNAHRMVPGDTITDFTRVWEAEPDGPRQQLIDHIEVVLNDSVPPAVTDADLEHEGLTGSSGAFKRNFIQRTRDAIYRLLKPAKDKVVDWYNITVENRKQALEYLGEFFEAAATFVKSVFPKANAVVEILSYVKQACKATAKFLMS